MSDSSMCMSLQVVVGKIIVEEVLDLDGIIILRSDVSNHLLVHAGRLLYRRTLRSTDGYRSRSIRPSWACCIVSISTNAANVIDVIRLGRMVFHHTYHLGLYWALSGGID